MDDSSCIPQKRCTRCDEEKPQTRVFFRPTRGGGFYPYCKECAKPKKADSVLPNGNKTCAICKKEKPETTEFFRRARGGFYPYCRRCAPIVKQKENITKEQKQCLGCGEIKPANEEFFHRLSISEDGFAKKCKQCRNVEKEIDLVPEGYKRCTFCNQIKPADADHFHRLKGNLRPSCKECENAKDRVKSHQETLEKQAIRALDAPPPGMKRCTRCQEIKPCDALHFHRRALVKNCGLEGECKVCKKKRCKEYNLIHADDAQWKRFMYKEANRETLRRKGREYAKANKSAKNATLRARQANINQNGGDYTASDVLKQLEKQHSECYWYGCHLYTYHVDHVIPIIRGGSNGPENIVLACPFCNLSKGGKTVEEWLVYLEKFILPRQQA